MKNVKVYFTALALSLSFILSNCTSDVSVPATEQLLIATPWKVDYYFQQQDLTSQFANVRILFSSTGTVAIEKSNIAVYGTWNRITVNNEEFISIHFNST